MIRKTDIELKREYWSQPDMLMTQNQIDWLVAEFGDKPATTGEGIYIIKYQIRYLFSLLPVVGRFFHG